MRVPLLIAAVLIVLGALTVPFMLRQDVTAAGDADSGALPVESGDDEVAALPTEEPDAEPTPSPSPTPEPTPEPEPEPEAERDPVSVLLDMPEPTADSGAPELAEDPEEIATWLTAAEQAIRHTDADFDELAAAAHIQQSAYRILNRNPEWLDEVVARTPEDLHPIIRANAQAGARLRAMHTPADPNAPEEIRDLPAWRINHPAPAEDLLRFYKEAEAESGTPWYYLASVNLVETRMGRIDGVSVAGAQGPMQFMPGTWEAYGEGDIHDPRDAIVAAGRYLSASGAPEDLRAALFAYNRSERYVEAILAHAAAMGDYEHYLDVYHGWRVYYRTVDDGDVVLEEGYGS